MSALSAGKYEVFIEKLSVVHRAARRYLSVTGIFMSSSAPEIEVGREYRHVICLEQSAGISVKFYPSAKSSNRVVFEKALAEIARDSQQPQSPPETAESPANRFSFLDFGDET